MRDQLSDAYPASAWHWGHYTLDPSRRQLTQQGQPVEIEDRVFDLLVLLLQHRERALDRQELCSSIWGKRPVSDATLRQLVYAARRAVGDDGNQQHTISTLYGRGLQWVAPVEMVFVVSDEPGDAVRTPAPEPEVVDTVPVSPVPNAAVTDGDLSVPSVIVATPSRRRLWFGLTTVLAVLVVGGVWFGVRTRQAPVATGAAPRVAIEPFSNATGDKSLDWIGNGLPGLLNAVLEQQGGIDVVDGRVVARALELQPTNGRSHEQQVRFATSANVLVGGSLSKLTGALYALKLRIARDNEAPVEVTLTGSKPGLLAADAAPRIRSALGLNEARVSVHRLPRDAFLAEAYARGRDFADRGKWSDAIELFRICVKGAPDFLPARLWLGTAQFDTDDNAGGLKTLQEVAALAARQGDLRMQARALEEVGHQARAVNDTPRALAYLQQAATLAQRSGDVQTETAARAMLADVLNKAQKPAASRRELRAAEALAVQHPELWSERALLYDMQGSIAGDNNDQQGAATAARAALQVREAMGDEQGVIVSMFNLALPLRALHMDAESLALSVQCYRRAVTANNVNMQFACGANTAATLLDFGLAESTEAVASQLDPIAGRSQIAEFQVLALQLRGLGALQRGDFAAALADLRKGDAVTDVSKLEYPAFLDQVAYQALATFAAAPQDMPAYSKRFDVWSAAHLKDTGFAQRHALVRALAAAAGHRPGEALDLLKEAAKAAPLPGDGDIEIRMGALLIALADHDQAAATIALADYDPQKTEDPGVLRLYARWMHQNGDAASTQRAEARLAQLQAQGRAAMKTAGLDSGQLLSGPAPSHASGG